jgi:sigma-B regulation protein RsbU (phosphoserine phosphatase)
VLKLLRKEYRSHRMVRFATWVSAYGAALWVVDRFQGGVSGLLWFVFWVAFVPVAVYALLRLTRFVKRKLLWRLRWRLMVTYVFIAVVPILLILGLVAIGAYIINGQFASFLVTSRLRDRAVQLRHVSRLLAHEADLVAQDTGESLLRHLQETVVADLRDFSSDHPGLEITLRLGSSARAMKLDGSPTSSPVTIPVWLGAKGFEGIVVDGDQLALRAADRRRTKLGDFTVICSQPFTSELLDQIGAGIGPVGFFAPQRDVPVTGTKPSPHLTVSTSKGRTDLALRLRSESIEVPPPVGRFDYTVRNLAALDPVRWDGNEERREENAGLFYVTSRLVGLDRQLVSSLGELSGLYWVLLRALGVVFLILELVALVIGVQLTRSMTRTVDRLHEGTERVKVGDFSYRISLPANDQLSGLGEAFDNMTASVERLLRESLEKTRLEGELEIARQVQTQLFPQSAPEIPGLHLYGVCKPARVVSGDYYDFLRLDGNRVGLVLGDISGKGISAALLMAAIQSSLHAQFYNGHLPGTTLDRFPPSTATVVDRLNRQLYAGSPPEKYATFFYAVYDALTRTLTYTTAGHPPPVLFRRDGMHRLERGGTVVGLFSTIHYEQAVVELEPGDLLLAFTDGLIEPENSYGEEFGEQRLLEVARRALSSKPELLVEEIYRSVGDWTGSPELQDDMTLLVAKALA